MKTMTKVGMLTAGLAVAVPVGLAAIQARDDHRIDRLWRSLEVHDGQGVFAEALIANLPAPVQRYFRHAIAPGTHLAAAVQLAMAGEIKLGANWNPFTARQMLTPARGFVWRARAHMGRGPLFIKGVDYYAQGTGRVRFALLGLLPVVQSAGSEVSKSALGRLLGESVWVPSALLPQRGVRWEASDDDHIKATLTVDGETTTLTFTLAADGRVREVIFPRWNSDERTYVPFGMGVEQERTFDGYTIPTRIHAGWWYGTQRYEPEGTFFRSTIAEARFQ